MSVSIPSPPMIRSFPAPPSIISFPLKPSIVLFPDEPVSTSSKFEPSTPSILVRISPSAVPPAVTFVPRSTVIPTVESL